MIAGCTQISSVACKPNWIFNQYGINEDYCKSTCYEAFQTNHYKMEEIKIYKCSCKGWLDYYISEDEGNVTQICNDYCQGKNAILSNLTVDRTGQKCYCDVNKCNP